MSPQSIFTLAPSRGGDLRTARGTLPAPRATGKSGPPLRDRGAPAQAEQHGGEGDQAPDPDERRERVAQPDPREEGRADGLTDRRDPDGGRRRVAQRPREERVADQLGDERGHRRPRERGA